MPFVAPSPVRRSSASASALVVAGAVATSLGLVAPAAADTLVQSGGFAGVAGPPVEHVLQLDQFDDADGTLQLQSVRIDVSIFMVGETVTNGSGGLIEIVANLSADVFLGGAEPLVSAEAGWATTEDNSGPPIATLYIDKDAASVTLADPADLAAWIGDGTIDVTILSEFIAEATPPGVIEFFASGDASWSVIYEFGAAPACGGDLDGDGLVGFADLLDVLGNWGACPGGGAPCPGDANGDGIDVGFADLLLVLGAWGPCP